MKLNIGAGATEIEGFTPIDRKYGDEAWPLAKDGTVIDACSVEEIRASHILEHFPHRDVAEVLRNWIGVLKPGGRLRVSVPDVDRIWELRKKGDVNWYRYLMGGQADENDYHKAPFTEKGLRDQLTRAGLVDVSPWESDNTDTASHPCSVNYQGIKPDAWVNKLVDKTIDVRISALISMPRLGLNAARGSIEASLAPFKIPLRQFTGAFWGHSLQNAFEETIEDVDWFLVFDYDTMCTPEMLSDLMTTFGRNPHIDALAAMQCRRHGESPLVTVKGKKEIKVNRLPFKCDTAHFGMTLIRTDALKKVPLPWFWEIPRVGGNWREDVEPVSGVPVDPRFAKVVELYSDYFDGGRHHLDSDIFFWKRWAEAGNTVYTAPNVRVGHQEEIVAYFDDMMQPTHSYTHKWRDLFCKKKGTDDDESETIPEATIPEGVADVSAG